MVVCNWLVGASSEVPFGMLLLVPNLSGVVISPYCMLGLLLARHDSKRAVWCALWSPPIRALRGTLRLFALLFQARYENDFALAGLFVCIGFFMSPGPKPLSPSRPPTSVGASEWTLSCRTIEHMYQSL